MSDQEPSSRIPGFYKLSVDERRARVQAFAGLTDRESRALRGNDPVRLDAADKMIENVVGLFHLPVGVAANFRIDDRDRLVPMVIEEPSVVAASSNAARLLRAGAGIVTDATAPVMIGQIQLCGVPDLARARGALEEAAPRLVELANDGQPRLVARGGGARELTVRTLEDTAIGPMLVVHLMVDVCDAMGANLVNGMVEALAGECEALSGGEAHLRILSNLADRRLVHATGRIPLERLARPDLGLRGDQVADRVVKASVFAEVDPYRAATHNKGIMNGVDAFLLATGQDWRAVEAGAHAYAARDGHYGALAAWRREGDELVGRITLPMQVGTVGGVTKVHPVVAVCLKVLDAKGASDVGRVAAAVGLAQNLAAILALATEGIQRGHMSLHARNIAAAVGAQGVEIDHIVAEMIRRRTITHAAAASILEESKGTSGAAAQAPMTMDELRTVRDRHWPDIERLVGEVVPREAEPGSLADMVWYQLGTGGKRLRAIIPLVVYDAFGSDPAQAVPFAAAVELLHNALLVHDDAEERLRTRRGRDTLWVRFGLDQAINCGDGLAYVALACLGRLPQPAETVRRASNLVARRMTRIIDAQVASLREQGSLEGWLGWTRDRTGGLFALAIGGAALLAGADDATVEVLDAIGEHLGVIFQVQDELMDLLGGKAGVPRASAIADGRVGLLLSHALEVAPPEDAATLRAILARPRHEMSDDDVRVALALLTGHGSLAFGADLMQTHQAHVDTLAEGLDRPEIARLLGGISDIFLQPLLERVGGDPA